MKTKITLVLGCIICLLLNSCNKNHDDENSHKDSQAFQNLTSHIWIETDEYNERFLLFNKDYTFKEYNTLITGTIVKHTGTYTFDEISNILKLYIGNDYCLHDCKVCKLTDSELWLAILEPLSGEYMFDDLMGMKCRRATQADNIPDFILGR